MLRQATAAVPIATAPVAAAPVAAPGQRFRHGQAFHLKLTAEICEMQLIKIAVSPNATESKLSSLNAWCRLCR